MSAVLLHVQSRRIDAQRELETAETVDMTTPRAHHLRGAYEALLSLENDLRHGLVERASVEACPDHFVGAETLRCESCGYDAAIGGRP